MICYLKHKNMSVLAMEIDDETSVISKVIDVINPNYIPIGVRFDESRKDFILKNFEIRVEILLNMQGQNISFSQEMI